MHYLAVQLRISTLNDPSMNGDVLYRIGVVYSAQFQYEFLTRVPSFRPLPVSMSTLLHNGDKCRFSYRQYSRYLFANLGRAISALS